MPSYLYKLMRSTKPHKPEEEYGNFLSDVRLSRAEVCERFVAEGIRGAQQLDPNGDNSGTPYIDVAEVPTHDEFKEIIKLKQETFEVTLNSSFDNIDIVNFFIENCDRNSFYRSLREKFESGYSPSVAQINCVIDDFENR